MVEPARKQTDKLSFDAWVAWAFKLDSGRSDLDDGDVFMMACERAEHGHVKYRVTEALEAAITDAGVDCEAFAGSLAIKIDDTKGLGPDALINRGPSVPTGLVIDVTTFFAGSDGANAT